MTVPASNRRVSLARRLSLLTGAVIALCLGVVLAIAGKMLTRSTIAGMQERLTTSTRQLASVVQTGIRQNAPRYAATAREPALEHAIEEFERPLHFTTEATLANAREVLARLVLPTDSGTVVELWNAKRRRLTYVGIGQSLAAAAPPETASLGARKLLRETIDAAAGVDSLRLSRLYVSGGRVYFWLVHRIMGRHGVAGYIAHERRIVSNRQTDQSARALAGSDVATYYGNDDATVSSTLGGSPASLARESSEDVLIAANPIPGTPLKIIMQSRRDDVLATVRATLRQLVVVGIVMIGAGMGAALLIGRRVARPIVAIASAAEAIARGQYDTRVPRPNDAETARLAESFNHMAIELAAAEETRRELAHMGRVAAVAELAASISHELRQPLTAIRANAEAGLLLLSRSSRDVDDALDSFQSIVDDCDRASNVIDHVRLLLRKESGTTTAVDLNEICRQAVHLLQPDAARRRTGLDLALAPNSLPVVGDPVQLQQVVLNLTLNALDAASSAKRQRRVTVSTAAAEDLAEIAIRDNGPGLASDIQQRLFEPFFTTKTQGLGMGLTIVRSIVERHHGRVRAENVSAGGAVFRVLLPVSRTAALPIGRLN